MLSLITMDDRHQFSIEVTEIAGEFRWKLYDHGMKMSFGNEIGQRQQYLAHGIRKTMKNAMIAAHNELLEFVK